MSNSRGHWVRKAKVSVSEYPISCHSPALACRSFPQVPISGDLPLPSRRLALQCSVRSRRWQMTCAGLAGKAAWPGGAAGQAGTGTMPGTMPGTLPYQVHQRPPRTSRKTMIAYYSACLVNADMNNSRNCILNCRHPASTNGASWRRAQC